MVIIKFCLVLPKIFLLYKVVRDAKKVEKHFPRDPFRYSKNERESIDFSRFRQTSCSTGCVGGISRLHQAYYLSCTVYFGKILIASRNQLLQIIYKLDIPN